MALLVRYGSILFLWQYTGRWGWMVKMGTKLNTIHHWFCFFAWIAFAIGAVLIIVSSLVFNNDNIVFFKIAHIYNSTVSFLSIFPVEPIIFALTLRSERRNNAPLKSTAITVVFFSATILLWISYISLFVCLIGGV